MTDAFSGDDQSPINAPAFEDLVGEGKKYADQAAVAKAIFEKDRFIERLKQEAAEAREAIAKRANEEEFLERLKQVTGKTHEQQDTPAQPVVEQPVSVKPEDIEAILERREAVQKKNSNLSTVNARLTELYGDESSSKVRQAATALGMSTDALKSIAADNPQAFYRLMGLDSPVRQDDPAPPRTRVNTSFPAPTGNQKDYAYYQKLRQEKGDRWYFSQQVQQEIWKAAKEAEAKGLPFIPTR